MGDCFQFALGSRTRQICDGDSELSILQANRFRALYDIAPLEGDETEVVDNTTNPPTVVRVSANRPATTGGGGCCGEAVTQPTITVARRMIEGTGVGGRLIEIFKSHGFETCEACYELAHRMNEWGVDGCQQNLDAIVAEILPRALEWEAAKVGWWAKLLPDAVTAGAVRMIVQNAIATARPLEWVEPPKPVARTSAVRRPATDFVTRPEATTPGSNLKTNRAMGGVSTTVPDTRPDGWWNDATTQQQHRDRATKFISTIPVYPGHFNGRGIVITGGGKYFVSAYVTIRVIRHVGCTLPIELWHLDGEMDDEMIDMVGEHGVTCHNASELARGTGYFLDHWWKGWQLKAFALLHSSYREVLMLDADSYPVRDPSFVFDWPDYQRTGAIIWPDVGSSARLFPTLAAQVLGVPQFTEGAAESGQLVANKEQTWRALNLAKHFNADADFVYHIVYGDKDTFPVAFHRLGMPYSRMTPNCKMNGPGIQQLDDRGAVLFNHRIHDKFRVFNTKFDSTGQRGGNHVRAAGWQHEDFCHSVLAELQERWSQ